MIFINLLIIAHIKYFLNIILNYIIIYIYNWDISQLYVEYFHKKMKLKNIINTLIVEKNLFF